MPLGEIVFDFYDKLKSVSKGYASFDYYPIGYRISILSKLDILLNGESVDALSALVHKSNAYTLGKKLCAKLKELYRDNNLILLSNQLLVLKLYLEKL